ncbi:hypothetical protein HOY80DRAFT_946258 [Tuber brumale]|nr:hypothetical protein HOY80DRAFT_946258 [Tuber brumale]
MLSKLISFQAALSRIILSFSRGLGPGRQLWSSVGVDLVIPVRKSGKSKLHTAAPGGWQICKPYGTVELGYHLAAKQPHIGCDIHTPTSFDTRVTAVPCFW